MRFWLLFLFQFFLSPASFAQSGDSLLSGVDTVRMIRLAEQEAQRWRDSVEAVRIKTTVREKGKPLEVFLQEMRERKKAHQRQVYFRIGILVLFFAVLMVGFFRRRRKT